jgi:hypothetical protein
MPFGKQPPAQTQERKHRGIDALYSVNAHKAASWIEDELALQLPDKPVDIDGSPLQPKLPADITRMSNDQLGKVYGQFVAVAQYADTQLGLIDIDSTDQSYGHLIEEAKHGLTVDGDNKDERAFNLRLNVWVKRKKEISLERRARMTLLEALIKGYDRAISALSREMSRRGMEQENSR